MIKKTIKTLSILALAICMLTGCKPAAPQINTPQPSSGTEENKQEEPDKKDVSNDFEKKLKIAQDAQDMKERDALILTQLEITNVRMSPTSYLYTITNHSNYAIQSAKFEFSPVTQGVAMLEGREVGDYEVIDDQWFLYRFNYLLHVLDAGETVHLNVHFSRMSRKGNEPVIEPLETDEPKLMNFTINELYPPEDLLKYVELTNFKFDNKKGPTYTLENKNPDTQIYPTVEIIYYKDGKPINMEAFNNALQPGEKKDIEPYYSLLNNANTYEPYEVAHDEIKTYMNRQ